MRYKTICISDVHLGSKDSKTSLLLNFLKHNKSDNLFLIGDIIDGWKIKQKKWKWDQEHTNCIRKILNFSKKANVRYIIGNHDEFLRPFLGNDISFGSISIHNQYDYVGINGKRYLVIHGDLFDGILKYHRWISYLGDSLYELILSLNTHFNWLRRKLGFGYWSLSKFLKLTVKQAVKFIVDYENNMIEYCKRKGYDGVICGHIHHAEIKIVDGIEYMNDGDFVESCTALVEDFEGNWKLITWSEIDETTHSD
ncbi:MAG: UDP-2,3-diacylglucosamine diphosphatase [Proteobacteria bacterium]|nr:UDP-2,3-diacylglucosamine diphosphatase [Pseudomonadota bacterium]